MLYGALCLKGYFSVVVFFACLWLLTIIMLYKLCRDKKQQQVNALFSQWKWYLKFFVWDLTKDDLIISASTITPINDLKGVKSPRFVDGEKLLRCKLASLYRLVDLCGWSHGIFNHISVSYSCVDFLASYIVCSLPSLVFWWWIYYYRR